jgi:stress response protein YsnF
LPRQEGDTWILPVLEEILVVEKRLMLREEVRVTPTRRDVHNPQKHLVRREHIEVERK